MTKDPRVIRACYSDWATIKTRKVLKLIFEIPLEQQAEVLTMLGPPMPGEERWCAIALLDNAVEETPVEPPSRSETAKIAYLKSGEMEQARTRSVMLAKDREFQIWCSAGQTEASAAQFIRRTCCGGLSRSTIANNDAAFRRFLQLEDDFNAAVGRATEERG